jgi:hypothetical protein
MGFDRRLSTAEVTAAVERAFVRQEGREPKSDLIQSNDEAIDFRPHPARYFVTFLRRRGGKQRREDRQPAARICCLAIGSRVHARSKTRARA